MKQTLDFDKPEDNRPDVSARPRRSDQKLLVELLIHNALLPLTLLSIVVALLAWRHSLLAVLLAAALTGIALVATIWNIRR